MKERNHLLDALRGIAALLVVFYHLGMNSFYVVKNGFLAVDLFFVLSGYVVAQSYEHRLVTGMTFRAFVTTRMVRLYPLLLLGLLIGFGNELIKLYWARPDALSLSQLTKVLCAALFVLPVPVGREFLFLLDAPLWSLFFELIANICFALFAFRSANWLLIAIVLISAVTMIFAAYHFQTTDVGWSWKTGWAGFARVGFGFTLGHVFYRVLRPRRSARKSWWALALVVAVAALLIASPPQGFPITFWLVGGLALCPLAVVLGTRIEVPDRLKVIAGLMGDLSYPLYAIHRPLLYLMSSLLHRAGVPNRAFVLTVPVLLLAAYIAARYYDAPIRRLLNQRLSVGQSAAPQAL